MRPLTIASLTILMWILLPGCSTREILVPDIRYVFPPADLEEDCAGRWKTTVIDDQRRAMIEEIRCERAKNAGQRAFRERINADDGKDR